MFYLCVWIDRCPESIRPETVRPCLLLCKKDCIVTPFSEWTRCPTACQPGKPLRRGQNLGKNQRIGLETCGSCSSCQSNNFQGIHLNEFWTCSVVDTDIVEGWYPLERIWRCKFSLPGINSFWASAFEVRSPRSQCCMGMHGIVTLYEIYFSQPAQMYVQGFANNSCASWFFKDHTFLCSRWLAFGH